MISAIIGIVCGFLLIGLPGALVLELVGLAYDYFAISPLDLAGDSVWPIAIMISLLWPSAITPLSILHYNMFPQQSLLSRWLFSLIGSLLITVVITFISFI